MAAIPPKADMVHQSSDVRFVPKADNERRRFSAGCILQIDEQIFDR
jgi:hypothetical protein